MTDRPAEQPFNHPDRWARRLAFPLLAVAVVAGLRAMRGEGAGEIWWLAAATTGVLAITLIARSRRKSRG
jgi:hypothetical protein